MGCPKIFNSMHTVLRNKNTNYKQPFTAAPNLNKNICILSELFKLLLISFCCCKMGNKEKFITKLTEANEIGH